MQNPVREIIASVARNQNELLRVLCASKASTQRAQRVSVTSVFSLFSATENTEKKIFAPPQGPAKLVLQRADKNELAISNGLAGKRFIKYLSVLFIGDGSAFAISGQVNRGLISSALATMTAEESWPLLGRAGS